MFKAIRLLPLFLAALMLSACGAVETQPELSAAPPVETQPEVTAEPPVESSAPAASETPEPPAPGASCEEVVVLDVPLDRTSPDAVADSPGMPCYTDAGGQFMGPTEFGVDGSRIYVLNTADNSVRVFDGDGTMTRIDLDVTGLYGIRMAVQDGAVYIFGVEQSGRAPAFAAVEADGTARRLTLMEHIGSEAVASLFVNGSKLYAYNGRTWSQDLETGEVDVTDKPMLRDGTLWELSFIPEDKIFTHTAKLEYTQPDGVEKELVVTASFEDAGIGGLRLLRYDADYCDLLVTEIADNADKVIFTAEYVLRLDADGEPQSVFADNTDNFRSSACSDTGALYFMSVGEDSLTVTRLPDVYTTPWDEYVSPLIEMTK